MPLLQIEASDDRNLRRTLETLPAGAYTCDAAGLITYFNRTAVELWGREPRLNHAADRWCGSFKLYSPDGTPIPHDQCWMALAVRDRKAYTGREIAIERPDGSRWFALAHANPFLNEQGLLVGAVNVLVDITDRKHSELVLARFGAIVESSEDAIISKDLTGVIRDWNGAAERLFGYTAAEAVGRSIIMLIPADRLDEEREILARLRAGERLTHFDTVRLRKDGQPIDVSLTISPIRDARRDIIGASKIARDIGDRKKDEAKIYSLMTELKEADRRKSDFLATLAHELRNPLNPIRNAVNLLRLKGSTESELELCKDVIDRQVDHLTRLVDDLLDISRITRDKLDLRKERTTLESVVNAAVELSRPVIDRRRHELTVNLPPEPIHLDADVVRLAQVFMNLLTNAAKYTEEGGHIRLTAKRDGSQVVVAVADDGIGIPPEKLPNLFEMFYQVEGARERSDGGLGIGLSLVRRLLALHGGSIAAESAGIGQGSEFIVRLPVAEGESAVEKPTSPQASVVTRAGWRILVVDDNRDAALSLAMLLRITGNETQTAHDGLEAVALAEKFSPDAVLLDIGLPKLNGYEAARRIRAEPWGKALLLVALTGWGQPDDRRLSREAGFNHHMVKPVDLNTLMGVLTELKRSRD